MGGNGSQYGVVERLHTVNSKGGIRAYPAQALLFHEHRSPGEGIAMAWVSGVTYTARPPSRRWVDERFSSVGGVRGDERYSSMTYVTEYYC